jgi:hypothetical protein
MAEMSEIKGDSAEAVAWAMLITIAKAEGGYLDKEKAGWLKDKILASTANVSPQSDPGRENRPRYAKSSDSGRNTARPPLMGAPFSMRGAAPARASPRRPP